MAELLQFFVWMCVGFVGGFLIFTLFDILSNYWDAMYRKHMRMSQSQLTDSSTYLNSRFIEHLAQIPAMFVAWNIAAGTYQSLKSSNKLLNTSLSSVEKAAIYITRKAEPVVQIFESQIKSVDNVACRGLETLERTIPVIAKQPANFIRYTQRKYNEMIESGLQKFEDVKVTTLSTTQEIKDLSASRTSEFLNSPSGQLIMMALNSVFDAYEMYLDRILPPLGDEGSEHVFGDREKPPIFQRADVLTERFKERFYKHSLLHIQNLRIRVKLTIFKLSNKNVIHVHVENM